MKAAKEVFFEELNDSLKSKRMVLFILLAFFIMLVIYASGFLQIALLIIFQPKNTLPMMISITYYILFITIPFFSLLLGYDSICGEIEANTIRGVISKIARDSYICGKFLANYLMVAGLSTLLLLIAAIYSYVKTGQINIVHTLVVIGYLLIYTACSVSIVLFFSTVLSRATTAMFLLTIFNCFMAYLAMGRFASIIPFHYITSAISFENIMVAVILFATYFIAFMISSITIFRLRDL
jgi:ABC-type transport system involved in multi-copper enzyme maturation permease subunit